MGLMDHATRESGMELERGGNLSLEVDRSKDQSFPVLSLLLWCT